MALLDKVKLSSLIEHFNFKVVNAIYVTSNLITGVYRPGLELVGYVDYMEYHKGIVLGLKESKFIESLDKDKKDKCFDILTNDKTPFILITDGITCPSKLLDLATRKSIPVLETTKEASLLLDDLTPYINEKLSANKKLHGTLVEIYGMGVLLMGESGIGKSEIALEFVKKGHQLISDDSVIAYKMNRHLFGKAPAHIKGFLEVRGLGIINVARMFGVVSVRNNCRIDLVINLKKIDQMKTMDRLVSSIESMEVLGVNVPYINLPVSEGRNMAELVEIAAMNYLIHKRGYDANEEIAKQYDEVLEEEE